MSSSFQYAIKHKLISPPKWLESQVIYEAITGSFAYGVKNDESDQDIYGICVAPKSITFPHTAGYIIGFDNYPTFEQYQQHGVKDVGSGKVFDFNIFNIVRYFALLVENNPNIVDALFVPEFCVKHITGAGQIMRNNRKIFLSKECFPRFRGYAASQIKKIESKDPTGKRKDLVDKHGFDTKFAYHALRLLNEAEQILKDGDLDLTKNNGELKAVRNGEWSYDKFMKEFETRKLVVEEIYSKSNIPAKPDIDKCRALLLECLDSHYGAVCANEVERNDTLKTALRNIIAEGDKIRSVL